MGRRNNSIAASESQYGSARITSEVHLAMAVIARSFIDLRGGLGVDYDETVRAGYFLTDMHPSWRRMRLFWCEIADICEKKVMDAAHSIMNKEEVGDNNVVDFLVGFAA